MCYFVLRNTSTVVARLNYLPSKALDHSVRLSGKLTASNSFYRGGRRKTSVRETLSWKFLVGEGAYPALDGSDRSGPAPVGIGRRYVKRRVNAGTRAIYTVLYRVQLYYSLEKFVLRKKSEGSTPSIGL